MINWVSAVYPSIRLSVNPSISLYSVEMKTRTRLVSGAVIAYAISGCTGGTEPAVPASIAADVSVPTATAGLALATAPTFSVKDASGKTIGGVPITIAVTAGGGTLTNSPSATTSGSPTSVGSWTLGKVAGVNTVTVTVSGLSSIVINVTGVAGPPASIAMIGGNFQTSLAGTRAPATLTAQVRDQFGNGIAGSVVTFFVLTGGGSIIPNTITTDASGNAGGAVWTLGKSDTPQSASANGAGFSTGINATVSTAYNLEVRFFGPVPSPEAAGAFTIAAARLRAMIVGDVPDIDFATVNGGAGQDLSACGVSGVILHEPVDDIIVYATVPPIDGPGKILASAGPCIRRSNPFQTIVGVMRFDADDIAGLVSTGRLNDVVLHEMMHTLGFGTSWITNPQRSGGNLLIGGTTTDPRFIGPLATSACIAAGGSARACSGGVAVEGSPLGAGTADSHWREQSDISNGIPQGATFDAELMTGFVEAPGVPTPLSAMTIQSLADLGYVVNVNVADNFVVPAPLASRVTTGGLRPSIFSTAGADTWETLMQPVFEITPSGQIHRVIAQ
jgi:hypothetical protein